jgi:hypothetical protein
MIKKGITFEVKNISYILNLNSFEQQATGIKTGVHQILTGEHADIAISKWNLTCVHET